MRTLLIFLKFFAESFIDTSAHRHYNIAIIFIHTYEVSL